MSSTVRTAWEAEVGDLEAVLAGDQLPALAEGWGRHRLVLHELLRRPDNG
jgi:hypothetical protein